MEKAVPINQAFIPNPVHSFVSPVYDKIQTSRARLAKLRKITLIHQYIDFCVVEEHNYNEIIKGI